MIAALDATPLTVPTGGVRRYTEELALALADEFAEDEYWLLSDQPFAMPAGRFKGGTVRSRRWWSLGLPRELAHIRAGVFHGTDFAVPYLPLCPTVMSLHDLSPWKDPAWHFAADRVRRRAPLLVGLGLATMVVTHSEAVRREAIETFRLAPARVVAVPAAASARFRPVPARPGVKPYYLY
ncbi:MAG: glycosyltransferase, partial [Bryobacteraceae bacterium]